MDKIEITFLNSNIPSKFLGLKISKFLVKNIFICGFQNLWKISIISKIMRDMKMNQKGKMLHLMSSLRLCSLKVHWITLYVPRLSRILFSRLISHKQTVETKSFALGVGEWLLGSNWLVDFS